jgi:diaminohydroxyphosphoribosylaminopyrimidine deaminase / 5-amino-6-(5-phosphoribosylamino)uracil reductase
VTTAEADHHFMGLALARAQSLMGQTWPNPTVGAVIVKDGVVIASGVTQPTGRPHAEAVALANAGQAAAEATLYVTLEPCAHASPRGPACADTLLAAGVARVVVAMVDPDPRTAGQGIARLEAAGVVVVSRCRERESAAQHQGFISRIKTGRPMVAVSQTGEGFEAPFRLEFQESFEQALDRLGAEGYNRVWVGESSPLASALSSRGLLATNLAQTLAFD